MRRLLNSLVVLAFALHSLVPAGFMLSSSRPGEMTVVICTGQGPQTITVDVDGKRAPTQHKTSQHGVCAYASVGALTLSQPLWAVDANLDFTELAFAPARGAANTIKKLSNSSARGPPALI